MAKAKLGVAFSQMRGKLGNIVLNKTKFGTLVREKVTPANPRTVAQVAVRANLSTVSRIWRNFTPAQVLLWEQYAQGITRIDPKSGAHYTPEGVDAFVELAAKYLQVTPGGTVPTTPPATAFTGDNVTLSVTAQPGKLVFDNSAANAAGVKTEILLQKLAGPNRKPQPGQYRSKDFVAFTVPHEDYELTVNPGYYAVAYRFVKVATGQASDLKTVGVRTVTLAIQQGGQVPAPKRTRKAA